MPFLNRADAGRRLAERLRHLPDRGLVVLGLPRGGVPVAAEVARALGAPLDVILVRKLGVPAQPELGMGAIGEGGVRVLNPEVLRMSGVSGEDIAAVEAAERTELHRRAGLFRGERPRVPLRGRTAVVIDDGIATGSTARAACQVARAHGAAKVLLAVPVAPRSAVQDLAGAADEVICLETPETFLAIGEWYSDFRQTSDAEVISLLREASGRPASAGHPDGQEEQVRPGQPDSMRSAPAGSSAPGVGAETEVTVLADGLRLPGWLTVPVRGAPVVLSAHGGSGRPSPRNRYAASVLSQAGLGTLLFGLLTPAEEEDRPAGPGIGLLGERLAAATGWLRQQPSAAQARVGYFGAGAGAAAALWAAVEPGSEAGAVVSLGGRPDLAMDRLARVLAPTLLIVGGQDHQVLELNTVAQSQLRCENHLSVVAGATHLFEEPGTLHQAAELARDWFTRHLVPAHAGR